MEKKNLKDEGLDKEKRTKSSKRAKKIQEVIDEKPKVEPAKPKQKKTPPKKTTTAKTETNAKKALTTKKKTGATKQKKTNSSKKKTPVVAPNVLVHLVEDHLPAAEPLATGQAEVSKVKVQFQAISAEQAAQIENAEKPEVHFKGSSIKVSPSNNDRVEATEVECPSEPSATLAATDTVNPVAAVTTLEQTATLGLTQIQPLPLTAIKVRNIDAKICDLVGEVICNKVIIQGILHEQLYFVGSDGIVHHLGDDFHFSTFVDIPGTKPGMNVQLSGVIEDIITELAPGGTAITKKFVLELFVKVSETVQVNLQSGDGPTLFVKQVVGENTTQTLVEADVILDVPAIKIDEIVGSVRDLEIEVIKDKVIIQGTLHKQIFFVDTANLGRHQGEDIHFSLFVDLPGALPCMDVQVHPNIEGIFFELLSPTLLRQKAIIEFFVKVTENLLVPVTVGNGPIFKVEEFIGENQVQELSDTTVELFQPALKIREIVACLRDIETHIIKDKVIVQGTIHKQIFFIGTDNIEYHQAEDVPFSVFLDIIGAMPCNLVHLTTKIEAVFFELLSPTELRQKVVIQINAVVTQEEQLNLVLGTGPLFKVDQVVGENTTQVLLVRTENIVSPVIPIPTPPTPPVSPITVTTVEIVVQVPGQTFSQQIILDNTFPLPVPTIKIKEIEAEITNLSARVVPGGVLVEGLLNKTIFYVAIDNIVRSISETIPFSILVNAPVTSNETFEATVDIEDIIFNLTDTCDAVHQLAVLRANVTTFQPSETFTVVTNVEGPGIVQTKLRVIANVVTPAGIVQQELDVVTDVSGPGITNVTKATIPLIVVGSGNPNPVPVEVVTNVV